MAQESHMMKLKKNSSILLVICLLFMSMNILFHSNLIVFAENNDFSFDISIFDSNGYHLIDRNEVYLNDEFITKDLKKYRIYHVDYEKKRAYATYIEDVEIPKIKISDDTKPMTSTRAIGLYMTHNDESYITGDGYDSVCGAGGIHDIAKSLKSELNKLGINVYLCENLHIPHDSGAYSRSRVSAQSLLKEHKLDAIFDIHRDGASRSTYVTNSNGEKCMVRMVVGKSNRNYEANLQFAKYLLAVSNKMYPWLFLDIYMGQGHYNQDLENTAMLFEMGSHMVEKSLVYKTVPALADVINTTLYGTTIDDDNNVVIGGNNNDTSNTVKEDLDKQTNNVGWLNIFFILCFVASIPITIFLIFKNRNTQSHKK